MHLFILTTSASCKYIYFIYLFIMIQTQFVCYIFLSFVYDQFGGVYKIVNVCIWLFAQASHFEILNGQISWFVTKKKTPRDYQCSQFTFVESIIYIYNETEKLTECPFSSFQYRIRIKFVVRIHCFRSRFFSFEFISLLHSREIFHKSNI